MAWGLVLGAVSLYGSYQQSQAQKKQSEFQAQQDRINAVYSRFRAQDALDRGAKEAYRYGQQSKVLMGQQRAALAAQGIDVDSGSSAEIQDQTRRVALEDMQTIQNNAWRESFGLQFEASNLEKQAMFTARAGRQAARNTLLAGGLKAAQTFLNFRDISFGSKKITPKREVASVNSGSTRFHTGNQYFAGMTAGR